MRASLLILLVAIALALLPSSTAHLSRGGGGGGGGRHRRTASSSCRNKATPPLWSLYQRHLVSAKYIDLSHVITPTIPVWYGFGPSTFSRVLNKTSGQPFSYEKDGFEATSYALSTDQLGTQLDPPAHWSPWHPAIDELPPTFAVRPLVVINVEPQVARDFGYQMSKQDVLDWEAEHGTIPRGAVVFVRSGWSKRWPDPALATVFPFPGVTLEALKFLHLERHILFHGHEALDTDTTPTLEGEAWLLQNGYTQAEGVANLDLVPPKGCLVNMGFPRFAGGTGGYARFVAICEPNWIHGVSVDEVPDSPMPPYATRLVWNAQLGYRTRG